MRVIAGRYRGRALKTAAGLDVRPTSDRLRETLFNVLTPVIQGSRFLDLCAGSGAVGIEALSRGAESAVFVEQSRRIGSIILANLAALGIVEGATVLNLDVVTALKRCARDGQGFDLVFFDPPYASIFYPAVLELLGALPVVPAGGIVIVERHAKSALQPAYGALRHFRQIRQGESALDLFRREQDAEPETQSE